MGTGQAVKTQKGTAGWETCGSRSTFGAQSCPVAAALGVWEQSGVRVGAGAAEGGEEAGQANLRG